MPRTKGSITCPFHKKRLVSECGCFKPYGLPEWREFTCCHCEEHVKHISQWGDMKRKPYFHASGQCIAVKVRWPQNSLTPPYFLAPLGSLSCILPHRKKRCVSHAFYSPACIVFDDFIFSPACIDSPTLTLTLGGLGAYGATEDVREPLCFESRLRLLLSS